MTMLLGSALTLLGIVAGIYVSALIHDHRIADLSAAQYTAMHQMRDVTFRTVMPPLRLTSLALVLASLAVAVAPGLPRLLGGAVVAMILIDIVLTVRLQVPLNQQVQGWTEATIPADWAQVRDKWASHHNVRLLLAVAAYGAFLAATFLSVG